MKMCSILPSGKLSLGEVRKEVLLQEAEFYKVDSLIRALQRKSFENQLLI